MDDERDKLIQQCRDLLARYNALDPEARAEFDRYFTASDIDTIVARMADGTMPDDEADRWLNAAADEFGQRKAVN